MHLYLTPHVGRGTLNDPLRPAGSEVPGWSAIDLAPAPWSLLALPERNDGPGRYYLGNTPDEPSLWVKAVCQLHLGVTLDTARPRGIIAELLMAHGRTDETRWRPLQPSRVRNRY